MKKTILFLLSFIFLVSSKGQITKGNWMLGGNANFSLTSYSYNDTKANSINVSPNIGYFFIDKLATGVRLGYYRQLTKFGNPNYNFSKFTNYSLGPYIRYYLLSAEKPFNIIAEGSYQFGSERNETNTYSNPTTGSNKFLFAAGPVIFFNSSVGIEFLLNYSSTSNSANSNRYHQLGAGIGLQVHLQKE